MTQDFVRGSRLWLAFLLVLAAFFAGAFMFARAQNIWIDETTQLSGMTLAPGALLAWLGGTYDPAFGVPADRMPPLSYAIDMIGYRLWGAHELAFRLYHAAITAAGILLLMAALARRFSLRAAIIAGLLLALSPKLIMTAVEIRAYPILLAISCAQVALLITGDIASKPRRLALFFLLGLLSGYTHFFGLIATSAYAAAAFIDARTMKAAARIVAVYALLLLCWTGLYPFVTGASAISSTAPEHVVGFSDLASFLAQTLASNAIMVDPIVAGLYLASSGALVVAGIMWIATRLPSGSLAVRHDPAVGLMVALAAGITVTIAASLLVASFDALASRYSLWMLPALMAVIAISADRAISADWRAMRIGGLFAFAILALSTVTAQALFLNRAEWFIHGPSRTLETMLAQAEGPTAVVHVGPGWPWGYFPLYRNHRDALPQWLLTDDGRAVIAITQGGDASGEKQPLTILDDRRSLIVSRVDLKSYQDLGLLAAGNAQALLPPGDLAASLTDRGWQRQHQVHKPGNFTFTGALYEHHPSPLPPTLKSSAPRIKDKPE